VDDHLKLLADVGLALSEAEEALADGAVTLATERLDDAADGLDELRRRWPTMAAGERQLVGRAAAPLRARLDAARARLPKRSALSDGAPEVDREQDEDPADAAA
jgi:hypothetical protein